MPATTSANKGSSSSIFAFIPRQVLLSNYKTMNHGGAGNGTVTLTAEQKLLLQQSVAHYLQRNGFSKSFKKFISEAKIEKDNLEESSVKLEELCVKYLEKSSKDVKSNGNDQKEQGLHSKNKEDGKSKEKKKKKSNLVSESLDVNVGNGQLESLTLVTENKVKDDVPTDGKVINGAESEKKSKRKTKKKDKRSIEGDAVEQIGDPDEIASKKENSNASNKEVAAEEKKGSKKRKRPISEENGQQVVEIKEDEETKRRKIETLNEDKLQKTSDEQANNEVNGYLENATEKSSVQKSQKKQLKGSSEPKSAKPAFQRVQVDKIEFHDERLQDNSYWAKDGAENGYGAKAQEILGQVRGRDFRHEKTKKKRGTYRGGPIDLQSHSIKFNYSDDE